MHTYPGDDNEAIVPPKLGLDQGAGDDSGDDKDATKSQHGNDNSEHQRCLVLHGTGGHDWWLEWVRREQRFNYQGRT